MDSILGIFHHIVSATTWTLRGIITYFSWFVTTFKNTVFFFILEKFGIILQKCWKKFAVI